MYLSKIKQVMITSADTITYDEFRNTKDEVFSMTRLFTDFHIYYCQSYMAFPYPVTSQCHITDRLPLKDFP